MRELTITEAEEVKGGNPYALGLATGLVANYIYESAGGAQGINNYFSNMGSYISSRNAYQDTWDSYNAYH